MISSYQGKVRKGKGYSVFSFLRYSLTASRKINDLDRSSSLAIASIFSSSSSSISKHAFTFIASILSSLLLYCLCLFLTLIFDILNYSILLESIRKLYIVLEPNRILSRGHSSSRLCHLDLRGILFFPSFSTKARWKWQKGKRRDAMVNVYRLDENGSYIYFIVSQDGFVKIGVANNPYDRLKGLQTANPHELSLELVIKGDPTIEKLMHKLLRKYHYRGEWFRFEGILKQFITKAQKINLMIEELYFIDVKQWVF